MALAATLVAGQSQLFASAMAGVTTFLETFGFCFLLLLVVCSFTSGIASCRKDGKLPSLVASSVCWSIVSTVLLSLSGALVFYGFSAKFPVTASTGADASAQASYPDASLSALGLLPSQPIVWLDTLRSLFPGLLVVCFVIGWFLKPNMEVVRPAYVVTNSFSETMQRIARALALAGYVFVFFASASFFSRIWNEGSIFVAGQFLTMLVIGAVTAVLLVLPLLFAIVTKFRINPYQHLYRSVAPMAVGLFTGDILLATLTAEPVARHNLGCQKRFSGTQLPFFALFGRGGSALVATLACLSLVQAVAPEQLTTKLLVIVALASALMSFASLLGIGGEVFLITVLVFRFLGINLYGAEISLIAILPLLNGIGVMIDTLVGLFGTSWTCQQNDVRTNTPYADVL